MQTRRGRRDGPGFASVDGLITSEIVCRRGIAVATDIGWKRSFATGVRIDIGLEAQCDFATIVDRNDAIRQAFSEAEPGDVVILAGKGHETTQTVGNRVFPFDDRRVAAEILSEMGWKETRHA